MSIRTRRIAFFVLYIVVAGGLYFYGYLVGHGNLSYGQGIIPSIVNRDLGRPSNVDFNLFWRAYESLRQKYIGTVDPQEFLYGAIRGSVASLNDPYTIFLTPEESKDFNQTLKGEFEGIGIEIALRGNKLTVIAPLDGSPAKTAGIRSGDVIVQINNERTDEMTLQDAVSKIRGKSGTSVELSIERPPEREIKKFTIVRNTVEIVPVKTDLKEKVGIITISEFGEKTVGLVREGIQSLTRRGADRFILDLRDNPGGFLEGAIDVSSFFMSDGVVVIEQDKAGKRDERGVSQRAIAARAPLIVLVNQGSASAAEIVAGALQDNGRAKIVGTQTFGKGSVQEFEDLPDGSSLKVTVALWLTPKGNTINEKGITPDTVVERTNAQLDAGEDPQLEKALSLIKE